MRAASRGFTKSSSGKAIFSTHSHPMIHSFRIKIQSWVGQCRPNLKFNPPNNRPGLRAQANSEPSSRNQTRPKHWSKIGKTQGHRSRKLARPYSGTPNQGFGSVQQLRSKPKGWLGDTTNMPGQGSSPARLNELVNPSISGMNDTTSDFEHNHHSLSIIHESSGKCMDVQRV